MENIKQQLEDLKLNDNKINLKNAVIDIMLDYETDEELKTFIADLSNSGCQSGMVSELIYYEDTNNFYDDFEEDIENLVTENMEGLGIDTRPLFIDSLNGSAENITQEKNLLSWFAFEEIVRKINEELKINEDYL